jgi:hypothetical protein
MEREGSENFRDGERLEQYLCIWRSQNMYERANDRKNTVERYVDRFDGLGMMKFHGLLSFQSDFQLQIPVPSLNIGFVERDARFFLPKSSAMVFRRE